MELRKPSIHEKQIIEYLIGEASSVSLASNWSERLLVVSMEDGGMGSLYLFPNGRSDIQRQFGGCVSDCIFADTDGVEFIASLYVDLKGQLFELDIWKTDFSPLMSLSGVLSLWKIDEE